MTPLNGWLICDLQRSGVSSHGSPQVVRPIRSPELFGSQRGFPIRGGKPRKVSFFKATGLLVLGVFS